MQIEKFIEEWISVGNSYNTEKYLEFYLPNSVLDDLSVGRKFTGKDGIKEYFESYFIGYQTQTRKIDLSIKGDDHAHLEVEFTGEFPEGKVRGIFDFTFESGKISFLSADLI